MEELNNPNPVMETPTNQNATSPNPTLPIANVNYLPNEVEVKKNSDNKLVLTNYRLFWQEDNTVRDSKTIVLPVDEISFIGYKSVTNWLMMILGIIWTLSSVVSLVSVMGIGFGHSDREDNPVGVKLLSLIAGLALIYFARRKFIVFSSSGGDLVIKADAITNLREWIDGVIAARYEYLRRMS